MAALGRSTPGVGIAPGLCGPDGASIEPASGEQRPLVWMARRNELAAGAQLRLREHRGVRALVERPAELALATDEVPGR